MEGHNRLLRGFAVAMFVEAVDAMELQASPRPQPSHGRALTRARAADEGRIEVFRAWQGGATRTSSRWESARRGRFVSGMLNCLKQSPRHTKARPGISLPRGLRSETSFLSAHVIPICHDRQLLLGFRSHGGTECLSADFFVAFFDSISCGLRQLPLQPAAAPFFLWLFLWFCWQQNGS